MPLARLEPLAVLMPEPGIRFTGSFCIGEVRAAYFVSSNTLTVQLLFVALVPTEPGNPCER